MMELFTITTEKQFKKTLENDYTVLACVNGDECVVPEIASYFYLDKNSNNIVSISYYDNQKMYPIKHEYDMHAIRGDKFNALSGITYNLFDFDRIYEVFKIISKFQIYGVYYNPYL